jgi:iron complex outermembrane recepter protein
MTRARNGLTATAAIVAAALLALPGLASAQEEPALPPPPLPLPPEEVEADPEPPPPPVPDPVDSPPPLTPPDTGLPPAEALEPEDLTPDDLADEPEIEEIVVTGSTVRRRDLITPAPVTILDKAHIDATGKPSIGEVLQNLVAQSNAINVQFNNGGDGSTRVNLRGLGANRTLVLLNGRRHVYGGTGANSSVDLNAIPFAVIERVEALKDGGSAVYGSDAIGGVVNIITRRGFDGVEASGYTATSQRGDGTLWDVSAVGGSRGDKGNVLISLGYYQQQRIMAGDRDYAEFDRLYDYEAGAGEDPVSTGGSSAVPEARITINRMAEGATQGNQAWQDLLERTTGNHFIKDRVTGAWRDFNPGGTSDTGEGDFYNYQPANYLVTPQRRYSLFSTGDYRLREELTAYYEASYTNRRSDQLLAPEPLFTDSEGLVISANNLYNPFGRDFGATSSTGFLRRRMEEVGGRQFLQDIDTFRVVTGVGAEIPSDAAVLKGWTWDLHLNYGRTVGTETKRGLFQRSKFAAALGPSFMAENGTPTCGTPEAPISGCVPLNLFGGAGSLNDEAGQVALRSLTYTGVLRGYSEQTIVALGGTGKLFNLPFGGPVGFAVGAQVRNEAGGEQPDPLTAIGDTTGNKSEPIEGDYQVLEGYGELSAVILQNTPAVDALELSAAVRSYSYDNFGGGATWKLGGRWQVIKDVALRGTVSTAFRAPSVAELFSGNFDDFPGVRDPCDTSRPTAQPTPTAAANCAMDGIPTTFQDDRSQLLARAGGNQQLEPETADVITAGIVLLPRFLQGFSLTVDYFNIKVKDSIQRAGAAVLLNNCYQQANRSDCDKIERNADGNIVRIIDTFTNIGGVETAGLDITAGYKFKAGGAGTFNLGLDIAWLQKYDEIQGDGRSVHGKGNYDLGVYPELRWNFSVIWGLKGWNAGANTRFVGGFKECPEFNCNAEPEDPSMPVPSRDVSPNVTADLYVSKAFTSPLGRTSFTIGVNNVTDQAPSVIYDGFYGDSDASAYDFLGRFFYARLVQAY